MSGCPLVGIISTFSMPMRRSSLATKSAALFTSDLCSSSVLTLGMRRRSFSSLRNRCWLLRANSTEEEAMGYILSRGELLKLEIHSVETQQYTAKNQTGL